MNLVLGPGSSVGSELAENPLVDLISFTGGGEAGRHIMKAASGNFKRFRWNLEEKSNIVFADADFDTAVDYALNAVFFHAGQVCSAGARLLVEKKIHDRFVEAIVERTKKINIGNGFSEGTEMGPVISAEHLESIEQYIQLGIRRSYTCRRWKTSECT